MDIQISPLMASLHIKNKHSIINKLKKLHPKEYQA
jgi:hypothetical protein